MSVYGTPNARFNAVRTAVDYAVLASDDLVVFTVTGKTATLPASPAIGNVVLVKCNVGTTTIDGNGKNIDGAATLGLIAAECAQIVYDGTEWVVT